MMEDLLLCTCLTISAFGISSWAIQPKMIDGVNYYFVDITNGLDDRNYFLNAEGATIPNGDGSIDVLINRDTMLRNWVLRHENCHVEQIMQNKDRSELECYVGQLIILGENG